jgi:hypothetical protein
MTRQGGKTAVNIPADADKTVKLYTYPIWNYSVPQSQCKKYIKVKKAWLFTSKANYLFFKKSTNIDIRHSLWAA